MHLLRVQGFCFAMLQYSHIQSFTASFIQSIQLYDQRHKTANRALQAIFPQFVPLSRRRYQTDTSGHNTTCATLERITAPGRPPEHTRYHRHARTLHRSAQPPYYNKVYKRMQHTADHASPAGSAPAVCGRWQVLTRCQQYRPGAPADWSASPPVQGQPGGL